MAGNGHQWATHPAYLIGQILHTHAHIKTHAALLDLPFATPCHHTVDGEFPPI
jgi:hypothetical protein